MADQKVVFIAFAIEDQTQRDFLKGQSLHPRGMAQARRNGKHVGRPALRKFQVADVERMRCLRSGGTSVRKLAKDFRTSQWMVSRLTVALSEQAAVS